MSAARPASSYYEALFRETPDERFHFRLAVPAECASVPLETPDESGSAPFMQLARFVSRGQHRYELGVLLTLLPRDIHVGDLIQIEAEMSGAKVVGRKDCGGARGRESHLLVEFERSGEKWLRRTRGLKDGPRVFRLDAAVTQECSAETAKACAASLASFQLLAPENRASAEELERWSGSEPCRDTFLYPQSWSIVDRGADQAEAALDLLNQPGRLPAGRLTVEVHARRADTLPSRLVRKHVERLRGEGVRLAGAPVVAVEPPTGSRAAHWFAPPASRAGHELCVGILVLEQGDLFALVGVLSPARAVSPWAWAINKRAFEIVRDSLSVMT